MIAFKQNMLKKILILPEKYNDMIDGKVPRRHDLSQKIPLAKHELLQKN